MARGAHRTTQHGTIIASGQSRRSSNHEAERSRGLSVEAVVLRTFVRDDREHLAGQSPKADQSSVVCDVLVVSQFPGLYLRPLNRVPVGQDRGDLHEGEIWTPRESTLRIDGGEIDSRQLANPALLDGERVRVSFLDDTFRRPIIDQGITPHAVDTGTTATTAGARLLPARTEGRSRYVRHAGSFYGVDPKGNIRIDTTDAHDGTYTADGSEPPTPEDGDHGNVTLRLPKKGMFQIQLGDDRILRFEEQDDGSFLISIPDGEVNLAVKNVKLGAGADQSVIKGNAYNDAHQTIDAVTRTFYGTLLQGLTALQAALLGLDGLPPSTVGELVTRLSTFITTVQPAVLPVPSAITAFGTQATAALSSDVKTR